MEGGFHKNQKKVLNGWAMYDWANSAYSLIITVAIFPAYFTGVTDDYVTFLGMEYSNSALYAYSITWAYIIIALITPVLSGIADYTYRKKMFMRFFVFVGSIACAALYFFQGMDELWVGVLAFMLASIGWAGSVVFYNAYLPEIASEDKFDRLSAKGYALGYVGSVILLLIDLVIIQKPEWFGITEDTLAVRICFLTVGAWWLGFSYITLNSLPKDSKDKIPGELLTKGFKELRLVAGQLADKINMRRFLISFFFYSAGVQTVLYMAATFAEKELSFTTTELILVTLILQIVAIGGAYLFAKISELFGSKFSITIMLVIWFLICIVAYFIQMKWQFYSVAAAVGLVMGGIQSMSRSAYSKFIPGSTRDLASYFSFYEVLKILAIVVGTFSFGFVDNLTGNMRISLLVLASFFIVGIVILSRVEFKSDIAIKKSIQ
jgi:UMF1 family MFS transporter